jgi:hypothetical protein
MIKANDSNASVESRQPSDLRIKSFPVMPIAVTIIAALLVISIALLSTWMVAQRNHNLVQSSDKSHAAGTSVQSDSLIPQPILHESPRDLEHR